jgi:peptide/nickel transport system permease protein
MVLRAAYAALKLSFDWKCLVNRRQYLIKKFSWALLTIAFVLVLNFFLFRVLPGDPARAGVRDPRLKKDAIEAIRVRFGLDKPVINCFQSLNPVKFGSCWIDPLDTQFFIYVRNLFQGEMGISFNYQRPVTDILAERLWNTIILIGAGQILAITRRCSAAC